MNIQKVLLGTLLVQPELAPCVLPVLEISDFEPDIQPIFAAAQGFWTATGKLETVQLCTRYPALKAAIMGCADEYSAECIHPNRENVLAWVRIVQEQAALNRFQSLALESANAAYDDLPELYSRMGETLTIGKNSPDFQSIGELTEAYIRDKDSKPQYIPTGVSVVDKFLHLSPGNLFIIGGRPSAGKTALSLQMACEQARRGFRVCYFSLETDPRTLTNRIIANRLSVPLAEVKAKTVPQHELDRLAELHKLPLFIRSASGRGVGWVKAQAQRMKAQVVFIDYLQLLADGKAKDRYQAIMGISIALHELAQTTGILVVALAQLNRNAAHAAPSTADLKESGQLEQDADAILLLSDDGERYRASLDKNKEGRVGILLIAFDKECQRFLEVEERR